MLIPEVLIALNKEPSYIRLASMLRSDGYAVRFCPADIDTVCISVLRMRPQLLIVDLSRLEGKDLLRRIYDLKLSDDVKIVINITSYQSQEAVRCRDFYGLDRSFVTPLDYEDIICEINRLCFGLKADPSQLRGIIYESICASMRKLNLKKSKPGYNYIRDALFIILTETNGEKLNLSSEIYPRIAERCNVTPAAVERSVRLMVRELWQNAEPYIKERFFGGNRLQCPSNKELFKLLASHLRAENSDALALLGK